MDICLELLARNILFRFALAYGAAPHASEEAMKGNFLYLALLVVSVVIFTIFICPFMEVRGLTWVCVLFYLVVLVTFLYGRKTTLRPRPRPPR